METVTRRAMHGRLGRYLQFLVVALLASGAAMYIVGLGRISFASDPTSAGGRYTLLDGRCTSPPGLACVDEEAAEASRNAAMAEAMRPYLEALAKEAGAPEAHGLSAAPGQRVTRRLGYNGSASGSKVGYLYHPPTGAGNLQWSGLGAGTVVSALPNGGFMLRDVPASASPGCSIICRPTCGWEARPLMYCR